MDVFVIVCYCGFCLAQSKSETSTFKQLEISISVSRLGWSEFVHHFETVASGLPNCSASHLLVMRFSASTTFSLLICLFSFPIFAEFVYAKLQYLSYITHFCVFYCEIFCDFMKKFAISAKQNVIFLVHLTIHKNIVTLEESFIAQDIFVQALRDTLLTGLTRQCFR